MPGQDTPSSKLFISYSRKNKDLVYTFADALSRARVDVWLDREEIDPLDDFPARIRDGLAQSHALLAWYSPEYAQSTYCQKELTAAWICAQRLTRNVLSRILIVNTKDEVRHVALGDVGRQNYLAAPTDSTSLAKCIQLIRDRLSDLTDNFAAVRDFKSPQWLPESLQSSTRFVGRLEELWRIHTGLNPVGISEYENASVVAQLIGLGGTGKSMLSIEYARRFGAAYPGGIYWLRAYGYSSQTPMDPEARERERRGQIEDLAILKGVSIGDKEFLKIREELGAKLALGAPYLWIVDDLPPGLDQRQNFPGWCAPTANGRTLITTRSRDYEGVGVPLSIDVLDAEAAFALLTQERKPQTEQESKDAIGLAEDLGRHALALDVAGHFLLKTKPFAKLRAELTREASDPLGQLLAGLSGQLPGGHEKSIVVTLLQSVHALGVQGLAILRLACELQGGTPLPLRLAKGVFARAFSQDEQVADNDVSKAVNQLEAQSLATILFGVEGDALSIHALVRYTMLHGDPAQELAQALRKKLHETAVSVLVDLLGEVEDIRNHGKLKFEVVHAKFLSERPETADEARLTLLLARFEGVRGNYREALTMAQKALPILESVLGVDDPAALKARGNIALSVGRMGNWGEALRLLKALLADRTRIMGADHPDTLATRTNIANFTGSAGNTRESLRLFRELLTDQIRVLGPDHTQTLQGRANVAVWTVAVGDQRDALCLLQKLLPDQSRALGADHPDTLTTRTDIAGLAGELGDAVEAQRAYEALLPDFTRVFGPDHPNTLTARSNLAVFTGRAGNVSEALRLFRALLPDQVRVMGKDHPDTLATRRNIAAWTGDAGDLREALRLYDEVLADQIRLLGRDHPATLITRADIARRTAESGNAPEALHLYQELVSDQSQVLGSDHPDVLASRDKVAQLTGAVGDRPESLRLFQLLLPDVSRVLGVDDPLTLTTRANIAWNIGTGGHADEGLRLLEALLPDLIRVLGNDHRITLTARNNVALLAERAGDRNEALRRYQELLPNQTRILGADYPNTLTTRRKIATLTAEAGQSLEALRLFQELLPDLTRLRGPSAQDTLAARSSIAELTMQTGNPGEALRLFQELLPDIARALGPDHPNTLATRGNIAEMTVQTGNLDEALRLLQELLADMTRVLGPDHPHTLATRSKIAALVLQTGNLDEALQLFQELLADMARVLGPDHRDTLAVRTKIAALAVQTGNLGEALRLFQDLLPDLARVLGPDHPDTARVREVLEALQPSKRIRSQKNRIRTERGKPAGKRSDPGD